MNSPLNQITKRLDEIDAKVTADSEKIAFMVIPKYEIKALTSSLRTACAALEFYSAHELKNAKIGMPISEILVKEFYYNGKLARQVTNQISEKLKG